MTRLPGDRAARDAAAVGRVSREYASLAAVACDYPVGTEEHKSAEWFFKTGAVAVRITGRVRDLVELDVAFAPR